MTYQIDGVDLDPQATEHEWPDYLIPLGGDGNGAPFYPKYQSLILRTSVDLSKGHDWYQYADGATHSVRVPAPGTTDDFTTYTSIYIWQVTEGVVVRKSLMRGVELQIRGVEV